jgi:hypothetical protein
VAERDDERWRCGGAPTSSFDLELETMIWNVVCSGTKLARWQTQLGFQGGRSGEDGDARFGEADGHDGATPASSFGRQRAREREQATPGASSPPHEAPGGLRIDRAAAVREIY